METPRARSPRPPPPLSSKSERALPPPPPPLSAATSPFHDVSFVFSSASSSPFGSHLHPLSMSMSRAPVGRVGSDLSHNSYSKASNLHPTTRYGTGRKDDKARTKNRTSPLFSGQRVKKYMTAMVERLRSFFHRQADREQRRQPHSFSGHGPNAAREMKERERWMRRRGGQLLSAPASLRVSPANSGHLSVGASVKATTSSEESTMEEMQRAVEDAIAHCKNSISRAQADDDGRRGDRTKQSRSSSRAP